MSGSLLLWSTTVYLVSVTEDTPVVSTWSPGLIAVYRSPCIAQPRQTLQRTEHCSSGVVGIFVGRSREVSWNNQWTQRSRRQSSAATVAATIAPCVTVSESHRLELRLPQRSFVVVGIRCGSALFPDKAFSVGVVVLALWRQHNGSGNYHELL